MVPQQPGVQKGKDIHQKAKQELLRLASYELASDGVSGRNNYKKVGAEENAANESKELRLKQMKCLKRESIVVAIAMRKGERAIQVLVWLWWALWLPAVSCDWLGMNIILV